jgi:hypothetical protein
MIRGGTDKAAEHNAHALCKGFTMASVWGRNGSTYWFDSIFSRTCLLKRRDRPVF